MNCIKIQINCRTDDEAKKISNYLLSKKLIACSNRCPIKSEFIWKGEVIERLEVALLVRTKEELWEEVKKSVLKIHSYEVPGILKSKLEVNKEYLDWVYAETKSL
jgi:periplasmic divalent cation tolerance protein